jgi:hypothetical protein
MTPGRSPSLGGDTAADRHSRRRATGGVRAASGREYLPGQSSRRRTSSRASTLQFGPERASGAGEGQRADPAGLLASRPKHGQAGTTRRRALPSHRDRAFLGAGPRTQTAQAGPSHDVPPPQALLGPPRELEFAQRTRRRRATFPRYRSARRSAPPSPASRRLCAGPLTTAGCPGVRRKPAVPRRPFSRPC